MNKQVLAVALLLGTMPIAAMAQPDAASTTTTTVERAPDGSTTTTKTKESSDGFLQYRKTTTATKAYDAGPFAAPSGYTYSRYGLGDHVPTALLQGQFDLGNYNSYALIAPPEGTKWIRVGDDGLLVSRASGEVVQADYGLFRG